MGLLGKLYLFRTISGGDQQGDGSGAMLVVIALIFLAFVGAMLLIRDFINSTISPILHEAPILSPIILTIILVFLLTPGRQDAPREQVFQRYDTENISTNYIGGLMLSIILWGVFYVFFPDDVTGLLMKIIWFFVVAFALIAIIMMLMGLFRAPSLISYTEHARLKQFLFIGLILYPFIVSMFNLEYPLGLPGDYLVFVGLFSGVIFIPTEGSESSVETAEQPS